MPEDEGGRVSWVGKDEGRRGRGIEKRANYIRLYQESKHRSAKWAQELLFCLKRLDFV